ncbi:MAG: hypothetical protein B6U95_09060 [Thermofilum sp. ex4484_82]|nr:MAG: hypothetical protein B6U95_09060 [Thermofilum sp. ex4484_82]OYT36037.1 MAG: hypothetical protein B6U96_09065 [Archaeoglobales archaeon ex4484_92]
MACCDGLFNSLPFILEDEETMTNCLKIFFKTYLQQNETLKLKDFYIKIPEDIRPSMLKKGFLKKIAEKTAEEELDIMFDEEREKLVRISFLLKTLRKYLEEKRKVNLEEVSGKMNISLGITIQMALKLLKEELEEAIKFIQY